MKNPICKVHNCDKIALMKDRSMSVRFVCPQCLLDTRTRIG